MKLTLKLILLISLLFICTMSTYAESLDEKVFYFINHDLKSPYLDTPMLLVTHVGDSVTQALAVGGVYLAGEKETATLLASALLKTGWTTYLVKSIVQRPRPSVTHNDVNVVGDYTLTDSKSFPSGHTTGAFAVATVLSGQYPKYTPYFYTYASLVGFSRIYVGVHYPSDVLAGAALGYLIGKSTMKNKNLIVKGNFLVYSIKF